MDHPGASRTLAPERDRSIAVQRVACVAWIKMALEKNMLVSGALADVITDDSVASDRLLVSAIDQASVAYAALVRVLEGADASTVSLISDTILASYREDS